MRLWKKILVATFFSILLLPAASLSSSASDDNSNSVCTQCGQGTMVISSVKNSPWEIVGSTPCTHIDDPTVRYDPWVLDEIQQRIITTTYTCDNCGHIEVLNTEETQIVHHVED